MRRLMFRRSVLASLAVLPPLAATVHTRASASTAEARQFNMKDFRLQSGRALEGMTIAYSTYGSLAPDGRNAVLLTHGLTSSHRIAGLAAGDGADSSSWHRLVGPGRAIDTDRLFVVTSNALGSCYGSSGPAHTNPATGKPYGPDFPDITLVDIVNAQKALLDSLNVKHLVAVAGAGFGGYQTFQWGITYPDFVEGLVPAVTSTRALNGEEAVQSLLFTLAQDRNWNGGWYYDKGGIQEVLRDIGIFTLRRAGIAEQLADQFPDNAAREAEIRKRAEAWSEAFDGNSLVTLLRASVRFNADNDVSRIKARVLYVLSRTDRVFPPSIAADVMTKLKSAGVTADYYEIDSRFGHSAYGVDAAKWAPRLRTFMAGLT